MWIDIVHVNFERTIIICGINVNALWMNTIEVMIIHLETEAIVFSIRHSTTGINNKQIDCCCAIYISFDEAIAAAHYSSQSQ